MTTINKKKTIARMNKILWEEERIKLLRVLEITIQNNFWKSEPRSSMVRMKDSTLVTENVNIANAFKIMF